MLDVLRRGASSWLSKLVLSLIILSFVAFGITTRLTGFSATDDALEVGSTKLSAADLDGQYRRALDSYSNQIGHPLSKAEAAAYGLPGMIMTDIIARTTLTEAAHMMGLSASDNAVRDAIFDDPTFKGPSGQFDRNLLRRLLYENRLTEDTYVADRREALLRQEVVDAVTGGLTAPTAMIEVLNTYSQEERTVDYITLNATALTEIADPAPDVLQKYFDERKAAFKAPELRVANVITIDPAQVSSPDKISDADAKASYDASIASYTTPEMRRVEQIPFDTKEAAEAAAKRLASGTTFDALVGEMKLKPEDIDLGLHAQSAFVDPVVAEAAFQLPKAGDVSGVVTGKFRNVILRVTEIKPQVVKSFDEAKTDIKKQLAASQADSAIRKLMKDMESAQDERVPFADLAKRFHLPLVATEPFDKSGKTLDGKPVTGIADMGKLIKGVFDSDIGNQNDPIVLDNGGYMLYDVAKILPPRDRTLDEVKADITNRWKAEQAHNQLTEKTNALVDRLRKGEDFASVAKEAGVELKTSASFKRSDTPDGLSPAAVASAFSGGEGTVAASLGPNDSRIILKVKDVKEPAFFAEAESLKQPTAQFTNTLKGSLQNEYLRRIQAEAGLKLNQAVIAQVLGVPQRPN
jgi:peptidyl-prolyl cis-trans isomerase D